VQLPPTALRLILVLIGAAAYGGLAFLGWGGGFREFFSHTALSGLFVVLLGMCVVALCAGGNLSTGVREDRSNRWVLALFAVIGLLDGYLPALTDRNEFWTIDHETVRWLGGWCLQSGVFCGCGPCSYSGRDSAVWSQSSQDTRS